MLALLKAHKGVYHLQRSIRNPAHFVCRAFQQQFSTVTTSQDNAQQSSATMAIKDSMPIADSPASSSLSGPRGLAEWQQRQMETSNSADPAEGGSSTNPFLSMLAGGALQTGYQLPPMTQTENSSWTFKESSSPCLDFFFQVVASTPPDRLRRLLEAAWNEDSLLALKLLFHLRGVRGTGKSEKGGFYTGVMWLAEKHPGTLLTNLKQVGVFGYYKDLLEIVLRLVVQN